MGQALYRQYRPKSLAEVVGQEHITETLRRAIEQGKIAHAYLFTGPRGVGKTSIARILAHEINQLPYQDDSMHLDIIEIDAASNRRIDEIRELRDKVHIAPTSATYKVYIIDEVHMLTREAFNALLKTLEEPPAHVVFILATTEAHKLPETIISRTQRFIFRPVAMPQVVAHLQSIATDQKLDITPEALEVVAAYGEGSFRDSISLLDQTRGHDGPVDADFVRSLIGIPTDEAIQSLAEALTSNDAASIVSTLAALRHKGFSAPQVSKQLGKLLRQRLVDGHGQAGDLELASQLLDIPSAHDPDAALELCLLANALSGSVPAAAPARPSAPATVTAPSQSAAPAKPKTVPAATPSPSIVKKPAAKPPAQEHPGQTEQPEQIERSREYLADQAMWPEILNALKKTHNTLYGIARMAKPTFDDRGIELAFGFAFHKKRFSEPKNQAILSEVIKSLAGRDIPVHCVLDKSAAPSTAGIRPVSEAPAAEPFSNDTAQAKPTPPTPAKNEDLSAISNIFGGAEVLSE